MLFWNIGKNVMSANCPNFFTYSISDEISGLFLRKQSDPRGRPSSATR